MVQHFGGGEEGEEELDWRGGEGRGRGVRRRGREEGKQG